MFQAILKFRGYVVGCTPIPTDGTPENGKSLYKPYIFPRIPREINKYHGYTYVRGTPNCPLRSFSVDDRNIYPGSRCHHFEPGGFSFG